MAVAGTGDIPTTCVTWYPTLTPLIIQLLFKKFEPETRETDHEALSQHALTSHCGSFAKFSTMTDRFCASLEDKAQLDKSFFLPVRASVAVASDDYIACASGLAQ